MSYKHSDIFGEVEKKNLKDSEFTQKKKKKAKVSKRDCFKINFKIRRQNILIGKFRVVLLYLIYLQSKILWAKLTFMPEKMKNFQEFSLWKYGRYPTAMAINYNINIQKIVMLLYTKNETSVTQSYFSHNYIRNNKLSRENLQQRIERSVQ